MFLQVLNPTKHYSSFFSFSLVLTIGVTDNDKVTGDLVWPYYEVLNLLIFTFLIINKNLTPDSLLLFFITIF